MKAFTIKTNFTGGEISPKLFGRVNVERYQNGLEELTNAYSLIEGGATRRAGTRFIYNAGTNITVRLIPFTIFTNNILQGYVIELRSDNKIRFYTNNGLILNAGNPYEITSPFTNADLSKIKYAQFNNILYLVHPDFPPQQLTRTSDTSWTIANISFTLPASQSVSSITRVDSTVTVTTAANHGYSTGNLITIAGANQTEYNGTFEITKTGNTTFTYTVSGTPVTPATGTITAQKIYWNSTFGYPSVITFFEQRLVIGATKTKPQTIWGSENGNILNLVTGVDDSSPFEFALSAVSSKIEHLMSGKQIIVFAYDEELTLQGGLEKPLTPTNVQIKEQTSYGARESAKPVTLGGEIIFVTRHGTKVRTFAYELDKDLYTALDIAFIAGHLTENGLMQIAKSMEPISLLWFITSDGKLNTLLYNKDQQLIAWSKNATGGLFKDVVSIPYHNTDQIWVAVQRTINTITKTYIEVFDPALNTDAAYTGYDAAGKTLWTGLDYLEQKEVDIVADGAALAKQTVTSGQITLSSSANNVEIGLPYETKIKDLPVEMQTPLGTTQGQALSVNRITLRLYKSLGGEIAGQALLPSSGTQQSKDVMVQSLGWDSHGVVTIEQKKPLPLTILAVIKEVSVNG